MEVIGLSCAAVAFAVIAAVLECKERNGKLYLCLAALTVFQAYYLAS